VDVLDVKCESCLGWRWVGDSDGVRDWRCRWRLSGKRLGNDLHEFGHEPRDGHSTRVAVDAGQTPLLHAVHVVLNSDLVKQQLG
jgi:hypothetical protein